MEYKASHPEEYLSQLPEDRRTPVRRLFEVVQSNLPEGFEQTMQYGMLSFVVPKAIYPKGYHVSPQEPLPFISIASQKNHIALYHMGLYSNLTVLNWFLAEYPKRSRRKLDMGKSCIRFKHMEDIPYELIGELCQKISVEEYITMYESIVTKKDV